MYGAVGVFAFGGCRFSTVVAAIVTHDVAAMTLSAIAAIVTRDVAAMLC